jgi:hypothetical protein
MNENLIRAARLYAARCGLELSEKLGSGKDGIVHAAKSKARPGGVAIKVLGFDDPYRREKGVYERLERLGVTNVLGFNVPQLIRAEDELRVIEMTIVKQPFVLDFAGAHLDARPEFSAEVWADWEAERREQFEARWLLVQQVVEAFEGLGIYLLDVSPGNIAFAD